MVGTSCGHLSSAPTPAPRLLPEGCRGRAGPPGTLGCQASGVTRGAGPFSVEPLGPSLGCPCIERGLWLSPLGPAGRETQVLLPGASYVVLGHPVPSAHLAPGRGLQAAPRNLESRPQGLVRAAVPRRVTFKAPPHPTWRPVSCLLL